MSSRRPQRRSGSFWFFAAGLAVVLVVGVTAVVLTRDSDGDGDGESGSDSVEVAASVSVDGESLPALANGDDPAIGDQAPVVEGEDFSSRAVTLASGGRPELVVFLAHWCPHCQAELPRLVEFDEAGGFPAGLDVVAVATGTSTSRDNYPPSTWLEREGWSGPVLVDTGNGAVANAYGLSSYPFFVLLDADGRVLARDSGELTDDQLRDLVALAVESMSEPDTTSTTAGIGPT